MSSSIRTYRQTSTVEGITVEEPEAPAEGTITSVVAEDAPLGVCLWPVREARYEDNYTLTSVAVVRNEGRLGAYVLWTYRNGGERIFNLGDQVACKFVPAATQEA